MRRFPILLSLFLATLLGLGPGDSAAEEGSRGELPEPIPVAGFEQLLPRGAIAAGGEAYA